MNAPLFTRDLEASSATLRLFALFHLNLAFSSIEEEQRADVIRRCYWPLLHLAEAHGPIGIEATGFTLEEIAARDPAWISKFREMILRGKAELIGSGYSQIIAPLVPAHVTEENLAIGNEVYERLLGVRPHLALVNEQAYSGGLVGLYLDAGYRALLMDWDNPSAHHPEWPVEARYRAERALGSDGRTIALLWTNTVAFQKLQRFAHGDIAIDDYLDYLRSQRGANPRTLCCYASDGEIFDFRPGRYKTEEKMSGGEWDRLAEAFASIAEEPGFALVKPSDVLNTANLKRQPLRLESPVCPIPVKKQRKYNLSRWAVTGRDDLGINAACQRIYEGLRDANAARSEWKNLCYLWSSDFRTHITDNRWGAFCVRLAEMEARWAKPVPPATAPQGVATEQRYIDIKTSSLAARLDRRRGLALSSLKFAQHVKPALGGLQHGHFDDIHMQADWYTGDCVFEGAGEHKITDLEWCDTQVWNKDGDTFAFGRIGTPKGPVEKTLRFHANMPRVDFDVTFHWHEIGRGSLRLGHFTLLPNAFDWSKLSLTTHNGGKECETFSLAGQHIEHGAPVSFLVSASHGLGMTEGWAEIGDDKTRLRVEIDRATAPILGLLTHKRVGGSLFCQLVLSALELDDTRKPSPYRHGLQRFRFSVNGVLPGTAC
jgi:hypothetical protein